MGILREHYNWNGFLGVLLRALAWRLHLSLEVLIVHEDHSSPLEVDRICHLAEAEAEQAQFATSRVSPRFAA